MRFYAEQKKMEQVQSDLNRIYKKLSTYQREINEIHRKIDWNIKQKALISQRIQGAAENLEKQTGVLLTMETSLEEILSFYCAVEERIQGKCEEISSDIDASALPANAASFLEGIDWDTADLQKIAAMLLLLLGGRWDMVMINQLIQQYKEQAEAKEQAVSDWISEIDDAATRRRLKEHMDYAKRIEEAYGNASGTAKELYDKYKDDIVIESMESQKSYHQGGKLYINYEGNIKDPRNAESIYYHETGHFIVGKEGWVSGQTISGEFQAFDQAVKDDVSNYIAQIEAEQREKLSGKYSGMRLEMQVEQATKKYLEKELGGSNKHVLDGVSDMIDAASNGKYNITYGHAADYWTANPTRQANEAFAEMYSADFCKDTGELDFIKANFPNAYREYENLKTSALNQ